MHFDDRLATVLRHRAGGGRAARTQYRQLLDLLGQRRHGRDESLLAAAWLRLGALGEKIPAQDRAAIVREPSSRFENPELAAHLAEDEPAVAAAALAAARLSEDDWEALIPRLPIRARGFLRLRRDLPDGANRILDRLGVSDRALPLPVAEEPLVLSQEAPDTPPEMSAERSEAVIMPFPASPVPANDAEDGPEPAQPLAEQPDARPTAIAALVERIEAFQRNRSEAKELPAGEDDGHPPLPFIELQEARGSAEQGGVVFTTDIEGRIDWADEALAPMLRYLVLQDAMEREAQQVMQRRLPLAAAKVTLEGAPRIAGEWYCDAAPRFDPLGGRFIGYAGRLRRASDPATRREEGDESDRIRQLLHELRTPVNAIQGFAEVIQQQLFGPVPHEYRALAANIAGDAARILAGFDELDRLAKLESGAREMETGESDFSAVVTGQLRQLEAILAPREAAFVARIDDGSTIALAQAEAESLSWRILAALGAALAPGEHSAISLVQTATALTLDVHLPVSLQAREDIFAAETQKPGGAGMLTPGSFGSGFALRLARAEARSAGGDLARVDDRLVLTLPLLTAQEVDSSPEGGLQEAARPGLT
ncbi:sensor histidine kinase [Erythrobacter sp. SDW2]|uniref:sensor histidine kinase n=1 Tax=Erythrobacter sp. SDW2 TaxID=2907154 RepID=UPI001F4285B6|nr:histidine kinase dimerization/phospho-acceptor domain-containing protein [Erythrobacter sp. SDW2]UIP06249.1 sensor histidine kinase [Erythrobacter sp. SDW2]